MSSLRKLVEIGRFIEPNWLGVIFGLAAVCISLFSWLDTRRAISFAERVDSRGSQIILRSDYQQPGELVIFSPADADQEVDQIEICFPDSVRSRCQYGKDGRMDLQPVLTSFRRGIPNCPEGVCVSSLSIPIGLEVRYIARNELRTSHQIYDVNLITSSKEGGISTVIQDVRFRAELSSRDDVQTNLNSSWADQN